MKAFREIRAVGRGACCHPFVTGASVLLLLFSVLVIASAPAPKRMSVVIGMMVIDGIIVVVGAGAAWLSRRISAWRARRRGDSPPVVAPPMRATPVPLAPAAAEPLAAFGPAPAIGLWLNPDFNRSSPVLAPRSTWRLGEPVTLASITALAAAFTTQTGLTWLFYTSPGWHHPHPAPSFWFLCLAAPLVAPFVGGILLRSWAWTPAAAMAFAAGGVLGLWTNGHWTMTNQVQFSLATPTIVVFPSFSAFAASLGGAIRLMRSGGLLLAATAFWALLGLCTGLGMVM